MTAHCLCGKRGIPCVAVAREVRLLVLIPPGKGAARNCPELFFNPPAGTARVQLASSANDEDETPQ